MRLFAVTTIGSRLPAAGTVALSALTEAAQQTNAPNRAPKKVLTHEVRVADKKIIGRCRVVILPIISGYALFGTSILRQAASKV
jgi:hypothetical protein